MGQKHHNTPLLEDAIGDESGVNLAGFEHTFCHKDDSVPIGSVIDDTEMQKTRISHFSMCLLTSAESGKNRISSERNANDA